MDALRLVPKSSRAGSAMKLFWLVGTALVLGSVSMTQPVMAQAQTPTLDAIKKRDHLLCSGVTANYPGFDVVNPNGEEVGLDVDICRAVATAILGDRSKFKTVPMNYLQRFTALQAGNIDMVAKNTTWTLSRNTEIGVVFTSPYIFTGDAFMVRKDSGIKKGVDLAGGTVCMSAGTTLEQLVSDFFTGHKLTYKPLAFENTDERDKAFFSGRCDASAGFVPGLAGSRSRSSNPDDWVILDDFVGKEIISAGVRPDDVKFYNIVNWTIFILLEAEEIGVTQANIDSLRNDQSTPAVRRLLGMIPGVGKRLGLRETWAYDVIKQNGNYAEMYERNVGMKSPLKLERGYSRLWKDGGALYSPSVD